MINRTVGAINCSLVVQLLIIQLIVFTGRSLASNPSLCPVPYDSRDSENFDWPPRMKSRLQRPEATDSIA